MRTRLPPSPDTAIGRQIFDLHLVLLGAIIVGFLARDGMAYFCVVIPAILPLYLWLQAGAPGMPALPIISGLSIQYYALPILRGDMATVDAGQISGAAASVGSFLMSAAFAYWFFLHAAGRRGSGHGSSPPDNGPVVKLAFLGMGGGVVFYLALLSGWLDWVGSYFGLVRAIIYTFTSIACFLLGSARASGLLRGPRWLVALGLLTAVLMFAVSGLLLVGGVMNLLAVILGYLVTARRIPWLGLAIVFAMVSVFQAGKSDIRDKYWSSDQGVGMLDIPGMMLDWFETGLTVVASGEVHTDALQRASLLWVVARVQEETPEPIPYLGGETYAMLPSMIVPRFVEPDKINSQAALNLLSVRYGIQSEELTGTTTVGFGLIAEAFANFGFTGVLLVGAFFGALCGVITWFSSGVSATSLRMFMAIAATSALLNLEADMSYLLVTIAQTIGAVSVVGFASMATRTIYRKRRVLQTVIPPEQGAAASHGAMR